MSVENVTLLESHATELANKWEDDYILCIEEDGIWISGMNINCSSIARRIRQQLENDYGYATQGPFREDGGLFILISQRKGS